MAFMAPGESIALSRQVGKVLFEAAILLERNGEE
jgi:hypothetical protein